MLKYGVCVSGEVVRLFPPPGASAKESSMLLHVFRQTLSNGLTVLIRKTVGLVERRFQIGPPSAPDSSNRPSF